MDKSKLNNKLNKLALRYKQHPTERMLEEIFFRLEDLFTYIASKFYKSDKEEIIQICKIAVWNALPMYEETKGNFWSYSYCCCFRKAIAHYLRGRCQKNGSDVTTFSLDYDNNKGQHSILLPAKTKNPLEILIRAERNKEQTEMIKAFASSEFQKQVVNLWLDKQSYKEIAKQLSEQLGKPIKWKQVDNALQNVIYPLKSFLKGLHAKK